MLMCIHVASSFEWGGLLLSVLKEIWAILYKTLSHRTPASLGRTAWDWLVGAENTGSEPCTILNTFHIVLATELAGFFPCKMVLIALSCL